MESSSTIIKALHEAVKMSQGKTHHSNKAAERVGIKGENIQVKNYQPALLRCVTNR